MAITYMKNTVARSVNFWNSLALLYLLINKVFKLLQNIFFDPTIIMWNILPENIFPNNYNPKKYFESCFQIFQFIRRYHVCQPFADKNNAWVKSFCLEWWKYRDCIVIKSFSKTTFDSTIQILLNLILFINIFSELLLTAFISIFLLIKTKEKNFSFAFLRKWKPRLHCFEMSSTQLTIRLVSRPRSFTLRCFFLNFCIYIKSW